MEIININQSNIDVLKEFLTQCEIEQQSFRYFKNRGIEAINNHIYTIMLKNENDLIGYGHLDKDGTDVWLGIMINHKHHGKGLAKQIMWALLDFYPGEIKLSVDKNNIRGINLYFRFGFTIVEQHPNYFIMSNKQRNTEIS